MDIVPFGKGYPADRLQLRLLAIDGVDFVYSVRETGIRLTIFAVVRSSTHDARVQREMRQALDGFKPAGIEVAIRTTTHEGMVDILRGLTGKIDELQAKLARYERLATDIAAADRTIQAIAVDVDPRCTCLTGDFPHQLGCPASLFSKRPNNV